MALPNSNSSPFGRALCIGVAAEADARFFSDLAVGRGFVESTLLLDAAATRAAVRAKLVELAALSRPGDLFLLSPAVIQAFDGRYFGVTRRAELIGGAKLLWAEPAKGSNDG